MELSNSTMVSVGSLEQVRDLLQMNIDSRDGFAYAGERLAEKHSELSIRFHRYSQQRNDFYEKLKEVVQINHQEPITRGTMAASLHRTWMELRDELNEMVDVSAVIAEAERGEGYIQEAYESAIRSVEEPTLLAMLKHQFASVQESYSWLAGLLTQTRNSHDNQCRYLD